MPRLSRIFRDARGASAAEFALIAPAFIMLIMGVMQLGILFFANAGLNSALAEGARFATIYPRPTTAQIQTRITAAKFGLEAANLATPTVTYGTTGSSEFADISLSYSITPEFIFFTAPAITIRQDRRVFLQPLPGA